MPYTPKLTAQGRALPACKSQGGVLSPGFALAQHSSPPDQERSGVCNQVRHENGGAAVCLGKCHLAPQGHFRRKTRLPLPPDNVGFGSPNAVFGRFSASLRTQVARRCSLLYEERFRLKRNIQSHMCSSGKTSFLLIL